MICMYVMDKYLAWLLYAVIWYHNKYLAWLLYAVIWYHNKYHDLVAPNAVHSSVNYLGHGYNKHKSKIAGILVKLKQLYDCSI